MPTIRSASADDVAAILGLLRREGLPADGVTEHLGAFFVAEEEGAVVGAAGAELYGDAALLRSVVVRADRKGQGLGDALARRAIDAAHASGARDVYLLTTTAAGYFPRLGFRPAARDTAPESLRASRELQGACPASAVLMRLAAR